MVAGRCLPTRSFQGATVSFLPGASGPKKVKAEMARPPRPRAGCERYPSGPIPLVKAVTGLVQLQGRGDRLHLLMKRRADSLWHILTHCRHQTVRGFRICLPELSPISTVGMWGWLLEGRRGSATQRVHTWTQGQSWTPSRTLPSAAPEALLTAGPTSLPWHCCVGFCFARAGVCNRKVQRPFQCAEISPYENQITSFVEKGLIARGTRQREFCCLFSLKKITVLSPVSSLHRSHLEIGL